ncbi:MAG: hypothetical protein A2X08_01155 [Bacteroidetes bacterium GWA2_32_17]|nr:MAG: hypothetical protein A2X08_01155 [Bacteroidetes bacterium GWA2_32_17]
MPPIYSYLYFIFKGVLCKSGASSEIASLSSQITQMINKLNFINLFITIFIFYDVREITLLSSQRKLPLVVKICENLCNLWQNIVAV